MTAQAKYYFSTATHKMTAIIRRLECMQRITQQGNEQEGIISSEAESCTSKEMF
jgi:hypothetical protein